MIKLAFKMVVYSIKSGFMEKLRKHRLLIFGLIYLSFTNSLVIPYSQAGLITNGHLSSLLILKIY